MAGQNSLCGSWSSVTVLVRLRLLWPGRCEPKGVRPDTLKLLQNVITLLNRFQNRITLKILRYKNKAFCMLKWKKKSLSSTTTEPAKGTHLHVQVPERPPGMCEALGGVTTVDPRQPYVGHGCSSGGFTLVLQTPPAIKGHQAWKSAASTMQRTLTPTLKVESLQLGLQLVWRSLLSEH